jgi:hypothetical protein
MTDEERLVEIRERAERRPSDLMPMTEVEFLLERLTEETDDVATLEATVHSRDARISDLEGQVRDVLQTLAKTDTDRMHAETELAVERRYKPLLSEWIAAAQSGEHFGRMLQEPTPARLREAIASATENANRVQAAELRAGLLETALRTLVDTHDGIGDALDLARTVLADTDGARALVPQKRSVTPERK